MAKSANTVAPASHNPELEKVLVEIRKDYAKTIKQIESLSGKLSKAMDLVKTKGATPADVATIYVVVKTTDEAIEETIKPIGGLKDHIKFIALPESFNTAGVDSLNLSIGYRVTLSETVVASIRADKRVEAYKWLRKNKHGGMITETVNSSTLGAFARAEIEANRSLPDDIFNVLPRVSASVTKIKKK